MPGREPHGQCRRSSTSCGRAGSGSSRDRRPNPGPPAPGRPQSRRETHARSPLGLAMDNTRTPPRLLGVETRRTAKILFCLQELGLLARTHVDARCLLTLTDRALALLSRRDRTSVGSTRKRWSGEAADSSATLTWLDVSGTRSRQLLRHIGHTEAVHRFMAALSMQARDRGWDVVQLDPPHRASRYFRHRGRLHSVRPDAFGVLRESEQFRSFFLEWERRAVRPVTMAARLAPYLRYYSSRRCVDDHGNVPLVLVAFDEELVALQFLRVARTEMHRAGIVVPLRVSHRNALESVGPVGPAWISAESERSGCVFGPVSPATCRRSRRP